MTTHFITSSGTGIGKTLVTAALAWQLRELGQSVCAIKPVISGFTPENATESDPGILLAALGEKVTNDAIKLITPWRYSAPLAPDLAASREGRTLNLAEVITFCREATESANRDGAMLLIEGVGGVMAPITSEQTVADWMSVLDIRAILVVGSYLGAISHSLTAVEVLAAQSIPIAAVVVSESEASTVTLDDTVETLSRFLPEKRLLVLPRIRQTMEPWRAAPDLTSALD